MDVQIGVFASTYLHALFPLSSSCSVCMCVHVIVCACMCVHAYVCVCMSVGEGSTEKNVLFQNCLSLSTPGKILLISRSWLFYLQNRD